MREDQADSIVECLSDLLDEIRGLRSDFNEFTGYNSVKMSDAVDQITGPLGTTLDDLDLKLIETNGTLNLIDINTTQ